ncbi:hypothetical protein DT019_32535 [Streptomyces sp. SDr-06]|uniref:hypothetical protein n=1 Tax=Streptomyces sp. SDr-06 TaxID=2267702 RepID=UPI000DEBA97A|nr:hypothetical protein [Streptomyces sp. SDr-06]RCH64452.1 hypothetical protein DT019_32535 [Streptomyces sp. SDr-06]
MAAGELLAEAEIAILRRALLEWCGPARCSDQLAVGMGFTDAQHLVDQCLALRSTLASDERISPVEWARVLLAVEIVFVSDLMGSGAEWPTTTGLDDELTIMALRVIHRKLDRTIRSCYGKTPSGH